MGPRGPLGDVAQLGECQHDRAQNHGEHADIEQQGRRIAWDIEAKFWLFWNGVTQGRTDGALVRLLTTIQPNETEKEAEERLKSVFLEMNGVLPRFIPN